MGKKAHMIVNDLHGDKDRNNSPLNLLVNIKLI